MKTSSLQVWTPFSIGPDYKLCISSYIPFCSTERVSLRSFLSSIGCRLIHYPETRRFGHAEYLVAVPGFSTPQLLFVRKVRA